MIRIVICGMILSFALIVTLISGCDTGENKTMIVPIPQASSGSMLVLFRTSSEYSGGSFGARVGADATCAAEAPAGVTNVHAFISIAPIAIADMPEKYGYPTNLPVYGSSGLSASRIADDWADLFDGNLDINLFNAGVLPDDYSWWSNSNSDGTEYTVYNGCDSFTSDSSSAYAMVGYSSSAALDWIQSSTSQCNSSAYLVCIGVK